MHKPIIKRDNICGRGLLCLQIVSKWVLFVAPTQTARQLSLAVTAISSRSNPVSVRFSLGRCALAAAHLIMRTGGRDCEVACNDDVGRGAKQRDSSVATWLVDTHALVTQQSCQFPAVICIVLRN